MNFYTGVKSVYDATEMEGKMIHFIDSIGLYKRGELNKYEGKSLDVTPFRNIACLQNGEVLFQPLLSYSIYKVSDGNCSIAYTLKNESDFKFIDDDQKKNIGLIVDKENDLIDMEKRNYFLPIGNILDTGNYLFLYQGYTNRMQICYSKNKKKSITIIPEELSGDEVQKIILSMYPKAGFEDKICVALDYMFVSGAANVVKNEKLKTFFENTKISDNPCIVVYRMRCI